MIGKFYAVMINSGDRTVPFEEVQKRLDPDDWLRLNFNHFCVYSTRTAEDIWKAVLTALNPADTILVIEVVPSNGWVTVNKLIHDWFDKPRL